MSTSKRPVPAVGQVWRFGGQDHELVSINRIIEGTSGCCDGKPAFNTCLDDGRRGYLSISLYDNSNEAIFVRHAPTPEAKPVGRFPPQAGDVWVVVKAGTIEDPGTELVFTGETGGVGSCFITTTGRHVSLESRVKDGEIAFVRYGSPTPPGLPGQPTTSVGSGSAAKAPMCWRGTCGNPALVGRGTHGWCEPCLVADGHGWRIQPEAHREDVKPAAPSLHPLHFYTAADFQGPAIVPDLKALAAKSKPRQRATYASVEALTYITVERGREYDRLMARLLADEGVTVDARVAAAVFESDAVDAEPDVPAVDEWDLLPGVNEFGSKRP